MAAPRAASQGRGLLLEPLGQLRTSHERMVWQHRVYGLADGRPWDGPNEEAHGGSVVRLATGHPHVQLAVAAVARPLESDPWSGHGCAGGYSGGHLGWAKPGRMPGAGRPPSGAISATSLAAADLRDPLAERRASNHEFVSRRQSCRTAPPRGAARQSEHPSCLRVARGTAAASLT